MKKHRWFAWVLVIIAVGLGCQYLIYGAQIAQVSASITIQWPANIPSRPLPLVLYRWADGRWNEVASNIGDSKPVEYAGLLPAKYRVQAVEASLVNLHIDAMTEFEVLPTSASPIQAQVQVRQKEIVEVELKVVAKETGSPVEGSVNYFRRSWDVQRRPFDGTPRKIVLAAEDEYTFEFVPDSTHAKSGQFGTRTGRDWAKRGLIFEVAVDMPTLVYSWELPDVALESTARLFPVLQSVDPAVKVPLVEPPFADPAKAAGVKDKNGSKFTMAQGLYDLPDGEYIFDATIGQERPPKTTFVLTEPLHFRVKDGKSNPSKLNLKFSKDRVGSVNVTVVDRNNAPFKGAAVGILETSGNVLNNAPADDHGKFDAGGFLPGHYLLQVSAPDVPTVKRIVEVKNGANSYVVSYVEMKQISGLVVDDKGESTLAEGYYYPAMNLNDIRRVNADVKEGKFAFEGMKDGFPGLLVMSDGKNVASTVISGTENQPVKLKMSAIQSCGVVVKLPAGLKQESFHQLWLCPKDNVVPVGIFPIQRRTQVTSVTATEIKGIIYVSSGTYDAMVLFKRNDATMVAKCGTVKMEQNRESIVEVSDANVAQATTLERIWKELNPPTPLPR